jgi:membrane-associated phospholipid phosphatase
VDSKDNSFLTWVARIVSLVLHPIWLPLVFIAWQGRGYLDYYPQLLVSSIYLIVFPGLVALLWMWMRTEEDWFVMRRGNRLVPLMSGLLGVALYYGTSDAFLSFQDFQHELVVLLGALLGIGVLITAFWKISLHMLSWGAVLVYAGINRIEGGASWPLLLALCLAALVAWARIRVKSHDILQIMAGLVLGIGMAIVVTQLLSHPPLHDS